METLTKDTSVKQPVVGTRDHIVIEVDITEADLSPAQVRELMDNSKRVIMDYLFDTQPPPFDVTVRYESAHVFHDFS
jgi:hypothetical protein